MSYFYSSHPSHSSIWSACYLCSLLNSLFHSLHSSAPEYIYIETYSPDMMVLGSGIFRGSVLGHEVETLIDGISALPRDLRELLYRIQREHGHL